MGLPLIRALALAALLGLAGCDAARLLIGGGPNLAANVQAGKTNSQTLGTSSVSEQKIVRPQGPVRQSADKITVNETPIWLVVAFAVALFLDSPLRWPGQIIAGFRKKKAPSANNSDRAF